VGRQEKQQFFEPPHVGQDFFGKADRQCSRQFLPAQQVVAIGEGNRLGDGGAVGADFSFEYF